MSSSEWVRKVKVESAFNREVELKRSAAQAMERAQAILFEELQASEALLASVADQFGYSRFQVSDD